MSTQVFWPNDLLTAYKIKNKNFLVLGTHFKKVSYVVFNILEYSAKDYAEHGLGTHNNFLELKINNHDISIIGYFGEQPPDGKELLKFELSGNQIISYGSLIVIYQPPVPQKMQFISKDPISISISARDSTNLESDPKFTELLKGHVSPREPSPQEQSLEMAIEMMNECWNIRNSLVKRYPDIQKSWEYSSIRNMYLTKLSQYQSHFTNHFNRCVAIPLTKIILYTYITIRHFSLTIIKILNKKVSDDLPSLIELSATAQQIDLRLQQFCHFPIQFIRTMRGSHESLSLQIEQFSEYIRLYNTLWLIINDVTIGVAIGAFLIENQQMISSAFEEYIVSKILFSDLNNISIWLMNSPGGVKLNNELSAFLSDLFRWIILFWKLSLIDPISPFFKHIVYILGISSTFGATLSIAIFSDFLSVITFHIYCFYCGSARIFNWQLNILLSLFHLFCGQKRNILRNRIDSNDYELDQILLGTLLFTVLVFLLPTVLAFYLTFAITELTIMLVTGIMELVMSLLNHFPIFILLLRLKDCKRIPGGLKFITENDYIKLKTEPLTIVQMFIPFTNVLKKLKKSYISTNTLKNIVTGHPIHVQRNKLYKLLYSALPLSPISTSNLLKEVKNIA
ncbi:hypothetical protein WICMUC_005824 [Wickerhamomyces mucosus]|uniref:Phosphatidylinositol N-acetylglucosaminyltransferase subunit GPI1 n=1 Tax=Wickerhamomyces mucosus TaxID=1378264 RepID=A0A9P8P499_9ASCO|nr:hypothetical protein WICMUC_005824 [Wickerhamomyces mucosus]